MRMPKNAVSTSASTATGDQTNGDFLLDCCFPSLTVSLVKNNLLADLQPLFHKHYTNKLSKPQSLYKALEDLVNEILASGSVRLLGKLKEQFTLWTKTAGFEEGEKLFKNLSELIQNNIDQLFQQSLSPSLGTLEEKLKILKGKLVSTTGRQREDLQSEIFAIELQIDELQKANNNKPTPEVVVISDSEKEIIEIQDSDEESDESDESDESEADHTSTVPSEEEEEEESMFTLTEKLKSSVEENKKLHMTFSERVETHTCNLEQHEDVLNSLKVINPSEMEEARKTVQSFLQKLEAENESMRQQLKDLEELGELEDTQDTHYLDREFYNNLFKNNKAQDTQLVSSLSRNKCEMCQDIKLHNPEEFLTLCLKCDKHYCHSMPCLQTHKCFSASPVSPRTSNSNSISTSSDSIHHSDPFEYKSSYTNELEEIEALQKVVSSVRKENETLKKENTELKKNKRKLEYKLCAHERKSSLRQSKHRRII